MRRFAGCRRFAVVGVRCRGRTFGLGIVAVGESRAVVGRLVARVADELATTSWEGVVVLAEPFALAVGLRKGL